ncbi:MAG: ribosome silencing factor [Dehalococcoidia bacterium]
MTSDAPVIQLGMETSREGPGLEPAEQARRITEIASERQASDILLLDVRKVCGFADYFVIMSSLTSRHTEALRQEIETGLREDGVHMLHREGTSASGWVLLDYGDVVVHIFSPAERDYYRLDELWERASTVVRIQ